MTLVLETPRLLLRRITITDAAFLRELMNEPAYLQSIGDRGVRTDDDASAFISTKIFPAYERFGFGHYVVESKDEKIPVGMMGFLKRDSLEHADIGFAFRQQFWSRGYAHESGRALLEYGHTVLKFARVYGLTNARNQKSSRVLEKLGLRYERVVSVPIFGECLLYATPVGASPPAAHSS